MILPQLKELLLQSLEHERGGVLIYRTALECVINDDLREEWEKYLTQTEKHVLVSLPHLRHAWARSWRDDAWMRDRA